MGEWLCGRGGVEVLRIVLGILGILCLLLFIIDMIIKSNKLLMMGIFTLLDTFKLLASLKI